MKLITDSNDPRFRELSEIWGPAVHSKDMIERNGAIAVAWLMESARVALARAEKAERELADEKQKVANLEEYMLKGVAFRDELQAQLCRAREALELVVSDFEMRDRHQSGRDEKRSNLCLAALSASSPCPHEAEAKRLREALNISPDEVGRIMHESWTRTKRAQGFHHQSECYALDRYESNGACPKCHSDLIPWEQLPKGQKDINRHAFDDVLAELRRRL